MIRSVTSRAEGGCDVVVSLPTPADPNPERIVEAIRQPPDAPWGVAFATEAALGKNSGGAIGLQFKNVIAVGSGKGGVGKVRWLPRSLSA